MVCRALSATLHTPQLEGYQNSVPSPRAALWAYPPKQRFNFSKLKYEALEISKLFIDPYAVL